MKLRAPLVALSRSGGRRRSVVEEVRNALRARFGDYAGPEGAGGARRQFDEAVPNPRIDFAQGRRRREHGPRSKRRGRMARLRQKARRVAKLRAVAGKRTPAIFTAGPLPEAVYGAAVNGLTDQEVAALRRAAAHAYAPRAKGRSLRRLMVLVGLPTCKAEVEVTLQYAREVWNACLRGAKNTYHWANDTTTDCQIVESGGHVVHLPRQRHQAYMEQYPRPHNFNAPRPTPHWLEGDLPIRAGGRFQG